MSRFDEFEVKNDANTDEVDIDDAIVNGSFMCQRCEETVHKASYYPDNQELNWSCSQGHVSRLKGFVI